MKKKVTKIMLVLVTVAAVAVGTLGCDGASDETAAATQTFTVQRGDISLEITAAGNLSLALTEDLTFDLFYAKGTVAEVMVDVGDTVTEGQVLASLDAAEWEEELDALETALSTAQRLVNTRERALITAQRAVKTKEEAVATAQRQVTAKELAVRQAQLDLDNANINLGDIATVKAIQTRIDNAEETIALAELIMAGSVGGGVVVANINFWDNLEAQAEAALVLAQNDMAEALGGNVDSAEVAVQIGQAQLQVELKELALEEAQIAATKAEEAVDDAELDLADAQVDVSYAELDLADAQDAVTDAQEALEEAQGKSLEITAPFDGFVVNVNVAGGDEILTGTVAIQLADPDKFEADILVSEIDIIYVGLGSQAYVSVDAADQSLPAEVTNISPTATIQSGVVNYSVRVEITSLEAIGQQPGEFPGTFGEDGLPEDFTPPEGMDFSGDFTPPEGGEMPEGFSPPEGTDFSASGGGSGQLPEMDTTEDIELREGMTVTVTLVIDESTDVLIVPNGAVTQQGGQSYVQVVTDSGETEQRAVTIGIADWQYTEIIDGLSEGELVVVPEGTTTTTSQSDNNPGGGGMMMPGMGGF